MLSVLGDKPLAVWVVARLLKHAGLLEAYLYPAEGWYAKNRPIGRCFNLLILRLEVWQLGSLRLYLTINAKS